MLNKKLSDVISLAKHEVIGNAKGELILPIRKKIWACLGEYEIDDKNRALVTSGLIKRTKLNILCIEHIIQFWNVTFPNDNTIVSLIQSINKYLNSEIDWQELWDIQNNTFTKFENMMLDEKFLLAGCVGIATLKALTTVLYDEKHIIFGKDSDYDESYDSYDWDTSYYSAMVYSGGGTWDENSDSTKRREFWLWYLDVAVPMAYVSS